MAGDTTIGEFCPFSYGKGLPEHSRNPKGRIAVYGSNGIVGRHDTALTQGPAVVVGRKGTVGAVHLCLEPCWPIDTTFYIEFSDKIEARFTYYLLKTLGLEHMNSDSAVPGLNRAAAHARAITVPDEASRAAIACILGTLDDKIDLNRRMNERLEAMARAIFKSWFVDFHPVRAKAEGREPGLPKHIADLFPDEFEESGLDHIPKGWRLGAIGDLAHINARMLGPNDSLDVIDYIEISEVMRGDVATITRYRRGEEPSRARRRLQHGDTVLSTVRPDRGAYFLCIDPAETLIASTGFAVLTPRDGNWAFVHAAATRAEVGQELGRLADGGAYPAVRPDVVAARVAVIPDDARLVSTFDEIAEPLFLRAASNRRDHGTLASIRDALLPKLISGELPIRDVDRFAGRCA